MPKSSSANFTSRHDLTINIISRYASPGEALRIAQVYLLKWHDEGQRPFATLVRRLPHADSVVRGCEEWMMENFTETVALQQVVDRADIPERSLKRRFHTATGVTLIDYLQIYTSRKRNDCSKRATCLSTRSAPRPATRMRRSSDVCSNAARA